MRHRAVLLINCAEKEAREIRERAARQRRTISGYIMNILMPAIRFDDSIARLRELGAEERPHLRDIDLYGLEGFSRRPPGPRTTMLLSCSAKEAHQIREAAKRRETTISALILHGLRRAWLLANRNLPPP
jgi:hypothetical protein